MHFKFCSLSQGCVGLTEVDIKLISYKKEQWNNQHFEYRRCRQILPSCSELKVSCGWDRDGLLGWPRLRAASSSCRCISFNSNWMRIINSGYKSKTDSFSYCFSLKHNISQNSQVDGIIKQISRVSWDRAQSQQIRLNKAGFSLLTYAMFYNLEENKITKKKRWCSPLLTSLEQGIVPLEQLLTFRTPHGAWSRQ